MTAPEPTRPAEHRLAIADEIAGINVGSGWASQSIGITAALEAADELLTSTDPAVHAAMLDALVRAGVLTEERTDGGCVRTYAEIIADRPADRDGYCTCDGPERNPWLSMSCGRSEHRMLAARLIGQCPQSTDQDPAEETS